MTSTPPTTTAQATISEAMARMWAKFLPEIDRRLSVLEDATAALASDSLTADLQQSAHDDAHKLAGSLGTFGLHQGTELARKVELMMTAAVGRPDLPLLTQWTLELRLLIKNR